MDFTSLDIQRTFKGETLGGQEIRGDLACGAELDPDFVECITRLA